MGARDELSDDRLPDSISVAGRPRDSTTVVAELYQHDAVLRPSSASDESSEQAGQRTYKVESAKQIPLAF